jgi:acetyl-CoA carboxylase biotin carboxylase subunit
VRVDTHLCPGCAVPYLYDPLLAKVITWASTRAGAIQRMRGALAEVRIEGVETNLPLLRAVVESREFRHGHYDTGLVESIRPEPGPGETAAATGVLNLRPCEALSS